jgi:hypothetical protein
VRPDQDTYSPRAVLMALAVILLLVLAGLYHAGPDELRSDRITHDSRLGEIPAPLAAIQ